MSFFNVLKSKPLGPLRVSPQKMTSPVGECIRYLRKLVGP
ncbi:hypothetical protein AMTRI_Chr08g204960 [Amborella trichopoda]